MKFWASLILIGLSGLLYPANGDDGTRRLLRKLFNDPDGLGFSKNHLIRPVKNHSDPVLVTLSLTVMNLELNFQQKSMTTNSWVSMSWNDSLFTWDPKSYEDVERIAIPPSLFWTPDITIYNDLSDAIEVTVPKDKVMVVIKNDGAIIWIYPRIIQTSCNLDEKLDEQNCLIKFGSWVHDGNQIDLRLDSENSTADLSTFAGNVNLQDWKLDSAPASRNVAYYACCPEPYMDVTFNFKFIPKDKVNSAAADGGYFKHLSSLPSLPWQ